MPSRTSVSVTARDGLTGNIPAANERAAGVMTAEQADQLARLWSRFMTGKSEATVISAALPTANYATTEQLKESIEAVQRYIASRPEITSRPEPLLTPSQPQQIVRADPDLKKQVADIEAQIGGLQKQIEDLATAAATRADAADDRRPIYSDPDKHPFACNDDDEPDADDLPAFLRNTAPSSAPSAPAVDLSPVVRELELVKARLAELEQARLRQNEQLQQEMIAAQLWADQNPLPPLPPLPQPDDPEPAIDIKASSIADIEAAGRARRAAAVIHGADDPALALNLATIAHLARSGQEGAFSVLAALAEARQVPLWQDVADDLIRQSDAALRIAVRTFAVETMARRELEHATDAATIASITGATINALRAIEG